MNKSSNTKLKSETAHNSNYFSVLFAHFTEPNGLFKQGLVLELSLLMAHFFSTT